MNRWHVQVLLLSGLIVFALPVDTDGQQSARDLARRDVWASMLAAKKDEQPLEKGFTYVLRGKQKPCILANMLITIAVGNESKEKNILQVAKDAKVEGACSSVISNLKLSWKEGKEATDKNNMIQFIFINDHSKFSVFAINLAVYHDKEHFPTATDEAHANRWSNASSDLDLGLFAASVKNGIHKCDKETKLNVGQMEITIKNISLIAFNTDDDTSSRKEEQCDGSKSVAKAFPYVLKGNDNSNCLMARMTASFAVSYKMKNSTRNTKVVSVPTTATVSGNCDSMFSSMELTWNPESESKQTTALASKSNSVQFLFRKEKDSTFLDTLYVNIFLDEKNFADAANVGKFESQAVKSEIRLAPAKNGIYNCPKNLTLEINEKINVSVSDVLLAAFDVQQDFASKRVGDCRASLSKDNFRYVVTNPEAEVPCTLANMSINVRVPYRKADSNTNVTLSVPANADVRGGCEKRSDMELTWPQLTNNKNVTNMVTFYIAQNTTHFFVYNVEGSIYLDEKNFPDAVDKNKVITGQSVFNLGLFAAPLVKGLYKCINQTQEVSLGNFDLLLNDVSFVAFNTDEYLNSKEVTSCAGSATDSTTTTVTVSPTTPSTTPATTPSTLPTTTVTNPPEPLPSTGYNYVVVNETTRLPCIVANMSISLKIPFATKESNKFNSLKVPRTAKTSGTCGEPKSTMKLTWSMENSGSDPKNEDNVVVVTFEKRGSEYSILSIDLDIYMDEKSFPGALDKRYKAVSQDLGIFSAPLNNLYKCQPETVVKARNAGITISDVTLMAFNSEKNLASKSVNCLKKSGTNVGAIVGGVIAAVAVLCLIGFLFMMYKKKRRFV